MDTAGEEDYQTMVDEWIKAAEGFLLLFAINDKESFKALEDKYKRIEKNNKEKAPIIVVGNKCDLEDQRQVNKEQGEDKAKNYEVAFMETSAFSGENLDKAFEKMMNEVFKKCHEEMISEGDVDIVGPSKDISLDKTKPKDEGQKKKCC